MRRDTLNFLVDLLALLAMIGLLFTGLVDKYLLPPGSRGGHGLELWTLSRHEWGDIHFWFAVSLIVLLILHVMLHWTWVCVIVQRATPGAGSPARAWSPGARNLFGLIFALVLAGGLGVSLWFAGTQVVQTDEPTRGNRRNGARQDVPVTQERAPIPREHADSSTADAHISGRTTLREAALAAHLEPQQLKAVLGLPASVPDDERLGRLRQQYGFDIDEVRQLIESHNRSSDAASRDDDE